MAQQITLKLAVAEDRHPALQRHPLLAGATVRPPQQLISVYYDTSRLALHRAGLLLRLRRQGNSWVQTLKRQDLSSGGLTVRPEWQAPYLNHFDFSQVDDAGLRGWLDKERIARRLASVFETKFRRSTWLVNLPGGGKVLAKLDRGWVASNGRRETISELELQLVAGAIDDVYAVARELAQNQALPPLLLSKAERGYRLLRNAPSKPTRAGDVDLSADDAPVAAFRIIALDCLTQLQSNHAGAVLSEDPEYVHQMRVATRRLRAAIRVFRPVLPATLEETLVPALRDLMGTLGQTRDLDVLMDEIVAPVTRSVPDEPRLADLAGAITNRLYAARQQVRQVLRQPAYGRLLIESGRVLHQDPFIAAPAAIADDDSLLPFAERRLRRLQRRIQELAATARVDNPTSLHELRIAIKRLRYAIEFFRSIMPGKARSGLVKRLVKLQDELGQLNDLANAGHLLMVCAGREQHLREAVALVGGWHGPRQVQLLAAIPDHLESLRELKLPRL